MKIGIYGGSFDPIHIGHAIVANYALQWGNLDEVWILISPQNPLKSDIHASNCDRLIMAERAFEGNENINVSDFEFSLPVPSFTYTTLTELKKRYPEHEFSLIIGSDNWKIFNKWANSEKIIKEFEIIIYPRPGFDLPQNDKSNKARILDGAPQILMSSTFVREALKNGKNINFFVPDTVCQYINSRNLYK